MSQESHTKHLLAQLTEAKDQLLTGEISTKTYERVVRGLRARAKRLGVSI